MLIYSTSLHIFPYRTNPVITPKRKLNLNFACRTIALAPLNSVSPTALFNDLCGNLSLSSCVCVQL